MRLLISIALCGIIVFAQETQPITPTPFKENSNPPSQPSQPTNPNLSDDLDFEENAPEENPMQNLNAIQDSFFRKDYKKSDNSVFINYQIGETYKIRLRYAMITTFVFDEEISHFVLGDEIGFSAKILGEKKKKISNMLLIKPLKIGIDSNLTIVGKSGKIYTFYIFSTSYTNRKNPLITAYISSENFFGNLKQSTPQSNTSKSNNKPNKPKKKRTLDDFREINYQARIIDDGKFLKIGDEVNHLYIQKSKIKRGYTQKPKAFSSKAKAMQAIEIFNDDDFTYFKFNRSDALVKFPVVYKVVDGYDNPVNSKVVGDYLVAEDVSDKWTLRMGDEYVCIRKEEK